jgi:hypothetical protein
MAFAADWSAWFSRASVSRPSSSADR